MEAPDAIVYSLEEARDWFWQHPNGGKIACVELHCPKLHETFRLERAYFDGGVREKICERYAQAQVFYASSGG